MSDATPEAEHSVGFNKGADNVVTAWQTDWQPFFADVCQRTGLTLAEAMTFHILVSSHITNQATQFIASKLQGMTVTQVPKEPWEE